MVEKITNVRKIKDLKKCGRIMPPKTERQIETARNNGILNSLINPPMKNPKVRKKVSDKLKGRILCPERLFKPGNQFGKLNKNTRMSESQKQLLSMINLGKPLPHLFKYQFTSEGMKKNNPMKNPEISKKFIGQNNNSKKLMARKKISQSNKTNPRGFILDKEWVITNPYKFEKGTIPWNKGLKGEEYKKHYRYRFKGIFQKSEKEVKDENLLINPIAA